MTEFTNKQPDLINVSPAQHHGVGSETMRDVLAKDIQRQEEFDGAQHIAETANYHGNWLLAQSERMAGLDFRTKYNTFVQENMHELREGIPDVLDKPEDFQFFHRELADSFDARRVFIGSAVGYTLARNFGIAPIQTGRGYIGERGTVFTDATTRDGVSLSGRQKDIISAHEAYHGVVKAPKPVAAIIVKGIDRELYYKEVVDKGEVKQPGYLLNSDELMARMAQLKNYYGMQDGEEFTEGHLKYARTHYVEDTGLDNSISIMFRMISPRKEVNFIQLMNTLPV